MIKVVVRLGAAAIVAAAVAGCTVDGHPVAQQATDTPATSAAPATPTVPPPASDEDQVRAALKAYEDAYNTNNWDAYLEVMCPTMRARFVGAVLDAVKNTRATAGVTTAEVLSVHVSGDNATVQMRGTSEGGGTATVRMPLKRGDDGWQICMSY